MNPPALPITPGSPLTFADAAALTKSLEITGLPKTTRAWRDRYQKNQLLKADEGKSYLIPWSLLPAELRQPCERIAASELAQGFVSQLPADFAAEPEKTELTVDSLNDKQRAFMTARLTVISYLNELEMNVGEREAVRIFIAQQDAGELPERVVAGIRAGNAKPKADWNGKISRATLYAWRGKWAEGKAALATKSFAKAPPPYWGPLLHKIYGRPQKPSIAACLRAWHEYYPDITAPEDWQAQRYLRSLPKLIREWGRHSKNALRALQPFTRRKTDGLWPMDVVTVDGHLFKAYVKHPETGKPFRPEITTYMDVATRKIVGVSLWIAESQYAIWLAMKDMIHTNGCGIPAIHYSDRGAYKGEEHRAIADRVGTTMMYAEPHRAQSRGMIERLNSSLYVGMAKEFEVYVGSDADREYVKKALKIANDTGANLPSWEESVALLHKWKDDYNNRPHRSLGGKTPNEAWDEAVQEGWEPTLLEEDRLFDLMPCKERICRRGEIKLPWGTFYADALKYYDGVKLRVHYEFNTGPVVWIADFQGNFICQAERDANARPYVADNAMQHALDKRTDGRLKRLEKKRNDILDEGRQTITDPLLDLRLQEADAIGVDSELPPGHSKVYQLEHEDQSEIDRRNMIRWEQLDDRLKNGEQLDAVDQDHYDEFQKTEIWHDYRLVIDQTSREEVFGRDWK